MSSREWFGAAFDHCRLGTLGVFEGIDEDLFRRQPHPEFSPIGWHLGHIAYTEAHWLLEKAAGYPPVFPEYHRLFRADGLPKAKRAELPTISEIEAYLSAVREQVWQYLKMAPIEQQARLWYFILQHESQHYETITFALQLHRRNQQNRAYALQQAPLDSGTGRSRLISLSDRKSLTHLKQGNSTTDTFHTDGTIAVFTPIETKPTPTEMARIPAGDFLMGYDGPEALDNEQPVHLIHLDAYWIDRYPVTCGQYHQFMQAGGYQQPQWWSAAGWDWLQKASLETPIAQPNYWLDDPKFADHPVCGVSWYEAEAYCNFAGKRLPTEAEWERAARSAHGLHPWGTAEPDLTRCNLVTQIQPGSLMQPFTTPVHAHPAGVSAEGVFDLLGNVWEWTSSPFQNYSGFRSYPYRGYSQAYFDSRHRVLKGGSWATRPWALRSSFRNWYHPHIRQILAGFRCAKH
ncbi:MAG: SUMF1/EgtB/PvdO family nonheme iron enzyme [Microcoleaceae cyanobacterium]